MIGRSMKTLLGAVLIITACSENALAESQDDEEKIYTYQSLIFSSYQAYFHRNKSPGNPENWGSLGRSGSDAWGIFRDCHREAGGFCIRLTENFQIAYTCEMLESGDAWEHEGWTYRVVPEISTESEYFIEARQNDPADDMPLIHWNYILTRDQGITHLVSYEEYEAEINYDDGFEPESEVYTARRATRVWRAVGEGVGQMSEVCGSIN